MKRTVLAWLIASGAYASGQTVHPPRASFHEIKWPKANVDSQASYYASGQVEILNTTSNDTVWRSEYFIDGGLAVHTAVIQAWRVDTVWTISPITYLDTIVYDSGYYDYRFGPYREYHAGGQLRLTGQYNQGLATGQWQAWDSAGNLQWQFGRRLGAFDGPFTQYYPNGKKAIRGAYRLNVRGRHVGYAKHGTWKYWDENGKLLRKEKHRTKKQH